MSDDESEIRAAGPLADAGLAPDEDDEEENAPPSGVQATLVSWYRRYIGEPDQLRDVYLGFGFFFGGVALGLVGLALFVVERLVFGADALWALRKVAFSVAALGLPTLLVGVVVLLPVDRRALAATVGGYAVTLASIGAFAWIYPYNWNVEGATDYAPIIVTVYAVGLVAVIAASGSALVSYHVERSAPAGEGNSRAAGRAGQADTGGDETVRDADVQRDIEEAMESTEMTWGGVQKDETRQISVSSNVGGDQSAFDDVEATETRSSGASVDDAVANLKGLKGGEKRTGRGSGTDEQTEALRQLKEQKRTEAVAEKSGMLERVKDRLSR